MTMKLKMKRKGKADKQTNGYFCKITADNEKKKISNTHDNMLSSFHTYVGS